LVLNDYDHTEEYARLIEACLDADVPIDVIGIQSHMHKGYLGDARVWEVCERLARFGKPLHWTEASLISGEFKPRMSFHHRYKRWPSTPEGEARQAEEVAKFYTVLFSHPAVEAVTWWDLPDHKWLGAPSGLVRADMTPKPAYERLLALVKGAWWTGELRLDADARGEVRFRGFLGDYRVEGDGGAAVLRVDRPGRLEAVATLR
jgi:GH35 family endo-1,4-beta-xylanase